VLKEMSDMERRQSLAGLLGTGARGAGGFRAHPIETRIEM
jgi:hypothetical protein